MLDPHAIAAEFLNANLDRALSLVATPVKGARDQVRLRLSRTYRTYIDRLINRHSKAKSFFVRDEPIPLYDFFVPLDLVTQRRTLASASAADIAAVSPRAILAGSGGSGKSVIIRHILISALQSRAKTPVFLELRRLDLAEGTLEQALLSSLRDNGLDVDAPYFRLALGEGHFLLLLDGFDELDRKARAKASTAIQSLAERYPTNWIVLTSRPDPELDGWAAFTTFRVAPLSLDKAVALVERLAFDVETKQRFLADLRSDLFERHQSFLSNPLLLSIMVLTYQDTAHIPNKLSTFYNQAYEALFQKHDAVKGGYQRARRTPLDIQDFARAFSSFCARTYDKRQFTFSTTYALDVLEKCQQQTQLPFAPQEFLDDARQAVCLLVDEGADITFSHRSFQEYFTARFVAASPTQSKGDLIKRFAATLGSDEVIPLLHEIDAHAVEHHLLLPAMQRLRSSIGFKRSVGAVHFLRYIKLIFSQFRVSDDHDGDVTATAAIGDISLFHTLRFLSLRYADPSEKWISGTREDGLRLVEAFRSEFKANKPVNATQLTTKGPFFKELQQAHGMWGPRFLESLVSIEKRIRQRHTDEALSLEAMLG